MPVPRRRYNQETAQQPRRVRLELDIAGAVVWAGDLEPQQLIQWWNEPDRSLHLECAMGPEDLGVLAVAVARLVIHARYLRLQSDHPGWNPWLDTLTRASPHAQAMERPMVGTAAHGLIPGRAIDLNAVTDELHGAMDCWMLDQADQHLTSYLATGSEPANWVVWRIQPELRAQMAQRWREWCTRLQADPILLGRLLRLAACTDEDNVGDITDRVVLVGRIRLPSIVRTLVLSLATAQAWPTSAPRMDTPGNFDRRDAGGAELATIHATGADLIAGEPLAMRAARHAWQASYVLLSELLASVGFDHAASTPFYEIDGGTPRLDEPPDACNVIVGADTGLLAALAVGAEALSAHLATTEARLRAEWSAQIDTGEAE